MKVRDICVETSMTTIAVTAMIMVSLGTRFGVANSLLMASMASNFCVTNVRENFVEPCESSIWAVEEAMLM